MSTIFFGEEEGGREKVFPLPRRQRCSGGGGRAVVVVDVVKEEEISRGVR